MAKITYYYRSQKKQGPITIRLSHKGFIDLFANTELLIVKSSWNFKNNIPKTHDSRASKLKTDLAKLEEYVLDSFNEDYNLGNVIDKEWLKLQIDLCFKRIDSREVSDKLLDNIQRIIDTSTTRRNGKGGVGLSTSRINGYLNLKKLMSNFQIRERKAFLVKDVDLVFSQKFASYMENENYASSYTQKKLADIKTVCLDAKINGVETSYQLPKVTGFKTKNDFIIYLNEHEIEKIRAADFESPRLSNAKRWLLIGCMVGQRGNDLLSLTMDNVVVRRNIRVIELVQEKGNRLVTIPVSEELEDQLSFGFPHKISLQKFNKYIKEICEIAEINEVIEGRLYKKEFKRRVHGRYEKYKLIASHNLRKSFATNHYGKMMTPLIMSITGHVTESSFLKYIGKTNDDYIEQIAQFQRIQSELKNSINNQI